MTIRQELGERRSGATLIAEIVTPAVVEAIMSATRCCLTCDHFKEANEMCALYMKRPPARVIAFGCPAYVNEIPF